MAAITPEQPAGTSASPANTQAWVETRKIGLREVHIMRGMRKPREYPFFCNIISLDHTPAVDFQVHGTGLMPEMGEGEDFPRQNRTTGGKFQWETFGRGNAVEITFLERLGDQYGVWDAIPEDQADAGVQKEEVDAASVIDNISDATFDGFVDGEALAGTHTSVVDPTITQSNVSVAGFSVAGMQQMTLHSHGLKDDDGKLSMLQFDLMLITAADLFAAREMLGSTGKPFSTDNELNSLIAEELSWLVLHFVTNLSGAVGISRNGHDMNFAWWVRPFQDTFVDPNNMNAISAHYQNHSKGVFRDWRGVYHLSEG